MNSESCVFTWPSLEPSREVVESLTPAELFIEDQCSRCEGGQVNSKFFCDLENL